MSTHTFIHNTFVQLMNINNEDHNRGSIIKRRRDKNEKMLIQLRERMLEIGR
jgi:hypothetical protein